MSSYIEEKIKIEIKDIISEGGLPIVEEAYTFDTEKDEEYFSGNDVIDQFILEMTEKDLSLKDDKKR